MVDVAIIGAGPAGCAAAIEVARAGRSVAIIESKTFPRTKVCGEYISPSATQELEALLGPDELRILGASTVDRLTLAGGDRAWSWVAPPAWVLSRAGLDAALLSQAKQAGGSVLSPETVRSVDYENESVGVLLNSGERVRAGVVVHADGSGRHDPSGATPRDRRVVGLKCHLRTPSPVAGLVMRPGRGAYAGLVGIESGDATCAVVARTSQVKKLGGNHDRLLGTIWPGYNPSWRVSDWHACPVPRSRWIASGHPRSIRVGNAAAAVDPAGGEGIGNALWSGRLAGAQLAAWLGDGSQPGNLAALHREMGRAYTRRLRLRLPACRLLAIALMRPALARALAGIGSVPVARSLTVEPWLAMTGKPMRG